MALPAPSQPPPPRRPGLRATSPERYEHMLVARDVLRAFVRRRRISERDLATCWCVSTKVVRDKLAGVLPIHLGEVLALPNRLCLDLLDEVRLVALARSALSSSHG